MSKLDSILWDIEDYAGRTADFTKAVVSAAAAIAVTFPFVTGGMLLGLAITGFVMADSGGTPPTIQQQVAQHNRPNGSTFWMMQAQGSNPTGFLGMDDFGNKKQETDFSSAVKFCSTQKAFTGCAQVIKAANSGIYGV